MKTDRQLQAAGTGDLQAVVAAMAVQAFFIVLLRYQKYSGVNSKIQDERNVETLVVSAVSMLLTHVAEVNNGTAERAA